MYINTGLELLSMGRRDNNSERTKLYNMSTTRVRTHIYLQFCQLRGTITSWEQEACLLPRYWFLQQKKLGFHGKRTDSRTGAVNIPDEPGAYCSAAK
jgi:hypothetical protein